MRHITALVAVTLLAAAASSPALASDSHFGGVVDPTADVPDVHADVLTTNGSYYGPSEVLPRGRVRLDAYLDVATQPSNPAWQGDTSITWLIDSDLNGHADWIVSKTLAGTVLADASGHPVCAVDDRSRFPPGARGVYDVLFEPACIGGPSAFTWAVSAAYDPDGHPENGPPVVDRAPDAGWSHPLAPLGGAPPAEAQGYWTVASDGQVLNFGRATTSRPGGRLNHPVVGSASRRDLSGVWAVAADGGVFTMGSAGFFGSTGDIRLNQPIVGMAATPSGSGYWLVARDGGIFSFGDAPFLGSTGDIRLNQPIVGMAATPSGQGYWLVASDGGIFTFGDAAFLGSTGDLRLNAPVVGMARTINGDGYWLVARDGGIFSFGGAPFHGSAGAIRLSQPIVGMATSRAGGGYRFVAADGGVFSFGDARFEGSAVGRATGPTVAISSS